jgi:hypothetical protein
MSRDSRWSNCAVLPGKIRTVGEAMLDKPMVLTVGGATWLVIGALLCFFGYFR